MSSGKVGNGTRAGTLRSVVMTGCSERGVVQKCHVWPRKSTLAIELSWVSGHHVRPTANGMDPQAREMMEPTSVDRTVAFVQVGDRTCWKRW